MVAHFSHFMISSGIIGTLYKEVYCPTFSFGFTYFSFNCISIKHREDIPAHTQGRQQGVLF